MAISLEHRESGYRREWLQADLMIAGLTTVAVVIPKAMAYATIGGLPVEVGLYTVFIPMVIYAVLGTSRPLSVSTTTTPAILTGNQLALVVPNGAPAELLAAAATLAFLVGVMLILASVLRLGVVASFISEPVLTGFKAGVGLVIVLDQVPKLLGIHFDKGGFLHNLLALVHHLPQATLATVVIVYSIGLIEPAEFRALLRIRPMEFLWALAAFAGVVLLGTLKGVAVAIIVSMIALAYQAAHLRIYQVGRKPGTDVFRPFGPAYPHDETFPGLLLVRAEGRIFFVNAQNAGEQLWRLINAAPRVLALDFSAVFDIEYSALKMLTEGEERLRERGITLWVVGLNPEALQMVQRAPLGATLGRERLICNLQTTVERLLRQPDGGKDAEGSTLKGNV